MAMSTNSSQGGGTKKSKVVVKQDMINFIKSQGMVAALKRAGEINAKGTKGEAEFIEGVKRMYGANRLSAATAKAGTSTAKATPSTRRKYGTPNNTSKPNMVDAKGPNAIKPAARKPVFGGTAQQKAQAAARAGGNLNVNRTTVSKPKATETPAQKAAKAALAKKRREASAAAVKRAGGRTM